MKKNYPRLAALSAALFLSALSPLPSPAATATDTEGYTYYDGTASNGSDRYVTKLQLTDKTNTASVSLDGTGSSSSRKVYVNQTTATPMKVLPGDDISVLVTGGGTWLHCALFIDWNNDKSFGYDFSDNSASDTNASHTVTSQSELVSFNMLNRSYTTSSSEQRYYNSKGEIVKSGTDCGNATLTTSGSDPAMPNFTIPADTPIGKYRARLTVGYNCIDATGVTITGGSEKDIAGNGGTMIDFYIEVVAKATVTIDTPDSSKGTLQVTKKGESNLLTSPVELPVGTELEITAQATRFSTYALQGVYADGEIIPATGSLYYYTVQGDVTISAKFVSESDLKPVVTVETPTNGTIEVKDADGNAVSGEVEKNTEITITATPDKDYLFGSLSINGTAVETTDGIYTYTVTADTKISATFTEKYAHASGSSSSSSRYVSSVTFTGTNNNSQTISISDTKSRTVWQDYSKTTPTAEFLPGEKITVTADGTGSWMHTYVYIDYNNDGIFSYDYNTTTHTLASDSELVTFNKYSADTSTLMSWYSSASSTPVSTDTEKTGDAGSCEIGSPGLPSFTLPESIAAGTYRVRYKVDWNSLDPYGASTIAGNGGEIIDFYIKVVSTDQSVTINPTTGGTVSVKAGDTVIESGATVASGTTLSIEATPDEGYLLTSVKVNDTAITAKDGKYTYPVGSEAITITAEFALKSEYKLALTLASETSTGGTFSVTANGTAVASGDEFGYETPITIEATPASYAWKAVVTANGNALTADDNDVYTLVLTEPTTLSVSFETKYDNSPETSNGVDGRNVYSITLTKVSDEDNESVVAERGTVNIPHEESEKATRAVWQDMTDQTIKVLPNDKLKITTTGSGYGMCMYFYLDVNNDGVFDITGGDGDILIYNAYSGSNSVFTNSEGKEVTAPGSTSAINGPDLAMPILTIPENLAEGIYYARLKIDWNNTKPALKGAHGLGQLGAEQIDFLIEVGHEVVVSVPSTSKLGEGDNAKECGSVKIKDNGDNKTVISSGEVTVEAVPNEKLMGIQFIGWTDADGNILSKDQVYTYSASEDASLVAHFGFTIKGKVNVVIAEGGNASKTTATVTAEPVYAVRNKKSAPALRADGEDSSTEGSSTDNIKDITADLDGGSGAVLEAGTTAYVNAWADGYTTIRRVHAYSWYTGETETYVIGDDEDATEVSVPIVIDAPKDVLVEYYTISTGVEDIAVDGGNAEAEYFNLNGVRVTGDLAPGLYIRRTPAKTEKVIIK